MEKFPMQKDHWQGKIVKMEIGALFPGYIYSCSLSHHTFILFIVKQKHTHSDALVPSNYYCVLGAHLPEI